MKRHLPRKALAGLCMVALITGAGLTFTGCATRGGGAKGDCKCQHRQDAKTSGSSQTSGSGGCSCSCSGKR